RALPILGRVHDRGVRLTHRHPFHPAGYLDGGETGDDRVEGYVDRVEDGRRQHRVRDVELTRQRDARAGGAPVGVVQGEGLFARRRGGDEIGRASGRERVEVVEVGGVI